MADHVIVNVEEQVARWFYEKGLHDHARKAIRAAESLPDNLEFAALEMQRTIPMTKDEQAERREETKIAAVERTRLERNRLLAASDWTQTPDSPLSEKERKAWADYRQKLRDHMGKADPAKANLPKPPEAKGEVG